jgi:hypothetical protein
MTHFDAFACCLWNASDNRYSGVTGGMKWFRTCLLVTGDDDAGILVS